MVISSTLSTNIRSKRSSETSIWVKNNTKSNTTLKYIRVQNSSCWKTRHFLIEVHEINRSRSKNRVYGHINYIKHEYHIEKIIRNIDLSQNNIKSNTTLKYIRVQNSSFWQTRHFLIEVHEINILRSTNCICDIKHTKHEYYIENIITNIYLSQKQHQKKHYTQIY